MILLSGEHCILTGKWYLLNNWRKTVGNGLPYQKSRVIVLVRFCFMFCVLIVALIFMICCGFVFDYFIVVVAAVVVVVVVFCCCCCRALFTSA